MYIAFKHLHSYLPYMFFASGLFLIVRSIIRWKSRSPYSKTDNTLRIIVLSLAHLQLIIGLILYFVSPITKSAFDNFGAAMKDSNLRLYAVEHITINLLAIILITIGSVRAKREIIEFKKHKWTALFFGIGTILILSRIPWHVWPSL